MRDMHARKLLERSRSTLAKASQGGAFSAPAVRSFYLLRLNDVNGHSGEGIVAQGIIFPNGWVSMCWLTDTASLTFYPSIDTVKALHGHDGATRLIVQSLAVLDEHEM